MTATKSHDYLNRLNRACSIPCAALLLFGLLQFAPLQANAQFSYSTYGTNAVITGYSGFDTSVVVPSTIDGYSVAAIGRQAFYQSSITDITIPGSVISIETDAFGECANLGTATLTNGLTGIGAGAFAFTSLTGITIPGTVTNIGSWVFEGCSALFSVDILGSVASIQQGTFDQCNSLTFLTISNGPTSIEDGAFTACYNLADFTIPATVTNIGPYAFESCYSLTDVVIPRGVCSIGKFAYAFSGVNTIVLPNTITNLGDSVFYGSDLSSANVPGSVLTIPLQLFSNCTSLTNVIIGDGVTSIGDYAFYGSDALLNVVIPGGVTSIGQSVFDSCHSLTSLVIPSGVTNIGDSAFFDCWALTGIYFAGDAPPIGGPFEFHSATNATVYYLPGTKGWGSTYGGRPTKLWNPLIQTGGGGFGLQGGQFGFNITGTPGIPLVVEASTNLAMPVWIPVQNVTLSNGSFYFTDPLRAYEQSRFYRLRSP